MSGLHSVLEWAPEPVRPWIWAGLAVALAVLGALILHGIVYFIGRRVTNRTDLVADSSFVRRTRSPARLVFVLVALRLTAPTLPLGDAGHEAVGHLLGVSLIAALTWLVIRVMSVTDDVILARYRVDVRDNLRARQVHTQTRVLSRTAMIVAAIVGLSAALMTFPTIRQFGASLLASAGIAGLVIGLAARPTLANLIAGVQLALTQPMRLDDVVIVEGEWGRIEEITATYVVVRIWDERRLVVPLQYFIEKPFQNWTRKTADILGTVFIRADYTVPVAAVRAELERIAKAADEWDGRVCVLQVTDTGEHTVELRALVSASDASAAWTLRCHVREKLIEYLQREHPGCLPRARAALEVRDEVARVVSRSP
jgi:small-conductance mechanosensitive channel